LPPLTRSPIRRAVTLVAVATVAAASLAACGDSTSTLNEPRALQASFATVAGATDMQISGSSDKGSPTGGSTFTYTFQVKWSSGGLATHIVFTDTLPALVSYNYATLNGVPFQCSQSAEVVTCDVGMMDKTSPPRIVAVNVNAPPTVGTFSNTGIITADTPDPQPENNRVTVTAQVKTALGACPQFGDQTVYTGTWAFGVGVYDPFYRVYVQFGLHANGVNYYVITNYVDPAQPLTSVINLDCKSPVMALFVGAGGIVSLTGVLDGSTITTPDGTTWQVLRANVIQAFTHKEFAI
jgi:uncharacterized repeat protein (TIGR01451 family)